MNQCVPGWDLDDPAASGSATGGINAASHRAAAVAGGAFSPVVVPMADQYYEVAELTWEKGNISSHGLLNRPPSKYPPPPAASSTQLQAIGGGGGGEGGAGAGDRETLEAVVGEAAARSHFPQPPPVLATPWLGIGVAAGAGGVTDALVPSARDEAAEDEARRNKRARVDGLVCASQGSTAPRGEGVMLPLDAACGTGPDDVCGFTTTTATNNSTSLEREDKGSPDTENTSIGGGASFSLRSQRDGLCDEEDNVVINGDPGMRSSISTKRSRAAAIHNESERGRKLFYISRLTHN